MRYLRNDVLSTARRIDRAQGHPSGSKIEWPFVTTNVLNAYPIVILNRAPVLESDEAFTDSLIETLRTIRRVQPQTLIIYRSTPIGHPYCDDATQPIEALTDEQRQHLPYGWSELSRRNAMAREIIEAAGGLYVDLAALTDLRPDGHVGGQDCLRYCIPGPADAWVQVMYHVFLGLEDTSSIL